MASSISGIVGRIPVPDVARLGTRVRSLVRPRRAATATTPEGDEQHIAPRDGGWAELFTADGRTRMGRGHLMIWPSVASAQNGSVSAGPADVDKDAGVALGGSAPSLKGELRSFTVDAGQPVPGDSLAVRPEQEPDSYPVVVTAYDSRDEGHVVHLDWPDAELPASLRELGGH